MTNGMTPTRVKNGDESKITNKGSFYSYYKNTNFSLKSRMATNTI